VPHDEHCEDDMRTTDTVGRTTSVRAASHGDGHLPRPGASDMRTPRMTTRRLLLAVAVLATLLGGAIEARRLWLRRSDYLQRADAHAYWCDHLRIPEEATYWENRWTEQRWRLKGYYPWPDKAPFVPAIAAYRARMRAKWERAAARPWFNVEPDPDLSRPPLRPGGP
jgi:hypothetical protein